MCEEVIGIKHLYKILCEIRLLGHKLVLFLGAIFLLFFCMGGTVALLSVSLNFLHRAAINLEIDPLVDPIWESIS